jgi:hypothetical protein
MWLGYPFRLYGRWTEPLGLFPRWFGPNAVGEDLLDPVEPPEVSNFGGNTTPSTPPGNGRIPADWVLTNSQPSTGSVLSSLFEATVNELYYLDFACLAAGYARALAYDLGEPEVAWLVEVKPEEEVNSIHVLLTDGTFKAIQKAESELELFYSGDWRWMQKGNCVLITGLDVYQTLSEKRGGTHWHFISSPHVWSVGAPVWVEHPDTKNWILLHPDKVRSDGFLGFYYEGGFLRVRTRRRGLMQQLPEFSVVVSNAYDLTARAVPIWNTVDEAGLFRRVYRRDGENNYEFGRTLQVLEHFSKSANREGLRNAIAAYLRSYRTETLAPGSTGFTLTPADTGFSIKGLAEVATAMEITETDGSGRFITRYSGAEFGKGRYGNHVFTSVTPTASSYVFQIKETAAKNTRVWLEWILRMWSQTGNTVTFTPFAPEREYEVFFPQKVRVNPASEQALKASFARRDPSLRWQSLRPPIGVTDTGKGLAEFE